MRHLSSRAREELYDRYRGNARYPICNLCSLPIVPGQHWDESHEKFKPRWLGGEIDGLAHRRCNRLHNNHHDTPLFHKNKRQRQKHIGAWQSRRPLSGGRDDPRKRTITGRVVDRRTGEPWRGWNGCSESKSQINGINEGLVAMKITVEATGEIQTVNGTPARLWKGKTESGIEVRCWVAGIEVSKDADNTQFERELNEVRTERQLVSYDMRLFID